MTDINTSFIMLVLATIIHMVEMNLKWKDVDSFGGYSEAAYTSLATKDEVYDGSASGETIGVLLDRPSLIIWTTAWIIINVYFGVRTVRVYKQEVKLIRSVGLTKTGDESFDYDSNVTDVHNMLEEAKKAKTDKINRRGQYQKTAEEPEPEQEDDYSPAPDDGRAVHFNPLSKE